MVDGLEGSNGISSNFPSDINIQDVMLHLSKIDQLVTTFKNYIGVLKHDTSPLPSQKIDFVNEQRQYFVNRVEGLLGELKMFSGTPIYQEVKDTLDQAKNNITDLNGMEGVFHHLTETVENFKTTHKNDKLIGKERLQYELSEELQSLVFGLGTIVSKALLDTPEGKKEIEHFFTQWYDRFNTLSKKFEEDPRIERQDLKVLNKTAIILFNYSSFFMRNLPDIADSWDPMVEYFHKTQQEVEALHKQLSQE